MEYIDQSKFVVGEPVNWLHFCGGDRGGVGKTLFCKILIAYYQDSERPLVVYDADRANLDVYRTNRGSGTSEIIEFRRTGFSDDPDLAERADEIIYTVLDGLDVVVNLPAGASTNAVSWWRNCRGIEILKRSNVQVMYWFLSGGDNFQLVKNSVERFGAYHILVKNKYLRSDWDVFDNLIEKSGLRLPSIEMERLSRSVADTLSSENLLIHDAYSRLKLLEKERLKAFTEITHERIKALKEKLGSSGVQVIHSPNK